MDHKHLPTDHPYNPLLNIIGGKGATSNINYQSIHAYKFLLKYLSESLILLMIVLELRTTLIFLVILD